MANKNSTIVYGVQRNKISKQNGSILVIVVILLSVLGAISVQFSDRSARFNAMSASGFGQYESKLFAEAAMNYVYSQFFNGGDLNGDGIADNSQIGFDVSTKLPDLSYMFYVSSDGTKIDQTAPTLLQRVADGEATNETASPVSSQAVPFSRLKLKVDDLSSNTFSARIYIPDSQGQLVLGKSSFKNEKSQQKAAIWIEIVADAANSSMLNLYVHSVGQSGKSRTYLQRYVGSVTVGSSSVLGKTISALTQNS